MASYTVNVSFWLENGEAKFDVQPNPVYVLAPSSGGAEENVITWVQSNSSTENLWFFESPGVSFPLGGPFEVTNFTPTMVIASDTNEGTQTTPFQYTIHVEHNGKSYRDDPQIVNKGGT